VFLPPPSSSSRWWRRIEKAGGVTFAAGLLAIGGLGVVDAGDLWVATATAVGLLGAVGLVVGARGENRIVLSDAMATVCIPLLLGGWLVGSSRLGSTMSGLGVVLMLASAVTSVGERRPS